jgi:hypothetical protein
MPGTGIFPEISSKQKASKMETKLPVLPSNDIIKHQNVNFKLNNFEKIIFEWNGIIPGLFFWNGNANRDSRGFPGNIPKTRTLSQKLMNSIVMVGNKEWEHPLHL